MRILDWGHDLLGFKRKPVDDVRGRIDLRQSVIETTTPAKRSHHQSRRFEGAIFNRLTEDFAATTVAIDNELRGDLDALRNRARHLRKNDAYVIKFTRMCRANIVGSAQPHGFTFQARVYNDATASKPATPDTLANNAIEAGIARWSYACDVTGRHKSLRALLSTVVDNLATDGEYLILKIRGKDAGNPFQYALQLLDVARIDTNYTVSSLTNGNSVVMGVERNRYHRPVAYHLWERPPGGVNGQGVRVRVDAKDIFHGFITEFAEQTRGIPWVYGAMKNLHQLKGYNEAAIIAARWGASKMAFFTRKADDLPGGNLADGQDDTGQLVSTAEPGEMVELPVGYDISSFDPAYPHDQFGEFNKAALRGIGSALNVAYHSLGNDLEGVNFSSIRSGTLEERDMWQMLQAETIEQLVNGITDDVLKMGLLNAQFIMPNGSAALPMSKFAKFANYTWQGRRWSWVDPLKDVQASAMAIEKKIASPQMIVAQSGNDLEDIMDAIKIANDMAAAAGVSPYVGAEEKPQHANATKPKPDAPESADD